MTVWTSSGPALDQVLYQADLIAGQGVSILARSRAEIERSVTNVRDATDWGNKLVQKIYTNPFVLSPFYKPSKEDLRVEAAFDMAQVFAKGAQELNDTVKTIEIMQAQVKTPDQQQQLLQLQQRPDAHRGAGKDVGGSGRSPQDADRYDGRRR